MKTRIMLICMVGLICSMFLGGGCSFQALNKDLEELETYSTITGGVTYTDPVVGTLVAVVVKDDKMQPLIVDYQSFAPGKGFIFVLPPSDGYRIFVYEDVNGDERYQTTERIVQSEPLALDLSGEKLEVVLELPSVVSDDLKERVRDLKARALVDLSEERIKLGTITELGNSAFDEENVQMGFWQPLTFTKKVPFGIFFLEEYSPDKIPVLFVHGVSGSPRHFGEIIAHIDRTQFQPWVVYYPSGFPISLVGEYLHGVVDEIQLRHGFKQLKIVAHSMGGLVSRSMLNKHSESEAAYEINTLITVSTPWNGHAAAEMGLKYAPAVVPVWEDILPGSSFLQQLFATPLPQSAPHYLLFGYRGKSNFAGGNSDGVVSIASQLRPEAQLGATLVRGFDKDHLSILQDSSVIDLINEIMEQ